MNTTLIMLFLSSLSALLIGWDYFGRYRLPQPASHPLKLGEALRVLSVILLAPYLYLVLPGWLLATLLGLATLRPLAGYFQPILADRVATWTLALALSGAAVALFVYGGADNPLFLAINNSIQLMAAVAMAHRWAWRGLKARDAALLGGVLALYVALFALLVPLLETLFVQLVALPFAPLVTWPGAEGQWVAVWRVDLLIATVFPLVLRRESGRTAGVVALLLNGLALAGVLLLPALGFWSAACPVMIVLGPLMLGQVGFWHWRHFDQRGWQLRQWRKPAQLIQQSWPKVIGKSTQPSLPTAHLPFGR